MHASAPQSILQAAMKTRRRFRFSRVLLVIYALIGFAAPGYAWLPGHSSPQATTGLSVDASDRTDVAMFFQTIYMASEQAPASMNWSGSVAGCSPGTTSTGFKDHTLRRINWYRAMTGTPADITFNSTKNTKAQQAALMMAAQNSLSHSPGTGWACYTAGGAEAAGRGNLALGSSGRRQSTSTFKIQVATTLRSATDDGSCLHALLRWRDRRYPSGAGHNAANCLWVIGDSRSPRRRRRQAIGRRKGSSHGRPCGRAGQYSYSGANFASANVSITKDGMPVPLTVESRTANGYGENTIVFNAPSTVGAVSKDTRYTVTITGIGGAAPTPSPTMSPSSTPTSWAVKS